MPYNIEQTDAQLLGSSANIEYTLNFDRAAQHLVLVTMVVKKVEGPRIVVQMPSWTPGSYKIRDYVGYQGNVEVFLGDSPSATKAQHKWISKSAIEIETAGASTIVLRYLVYGNERTVRTNHINRFHAFIVPTATLMYVEGRTDEIHHVTIECDKQLWPNISTQLSPVTQQHGGAVTLGALSYDLLADSPMEIGNHAVATFDAQGAKHEVAIASNETVDIDWMVAQLKTIVDTEAKVFGGVPYDRYVFILHVYPKIYGGLEHARSSVNAFDPGALCDAKKALGPLALLCHEFFHLWNIKRIRPIEYGPFDYTTEQYSSMLWLAEGLTSYVDDLFTYRCGFRTEKDYIKAIANDHLTRLHNVPGRLVMNVRDSSYLAWAKLYMQSPDGSNRFPSYYLKGGVIFLLLDLYVIDHTDGKKSIDDILQALWKRYQDNPSVGLTEEETIALMERATGVQLRELFLGWLNGTDELDYAELFHTVGYSVELEIQKPTDTTFGEELPMGAQHPELFVGWGLKESDGKLVVSQVFDGGAASEAGIGIDDEVVAINGKRVASSQQASEYISQSGMSDIQLTCECDGKIYSTTMRPKPLEKIVVKELETITERQQKMRDVWLKR